MIDDPTSHEDTSSAGTPDAAPEPEQDDGASFASFGLDERIVAAVAALGYETATPIQQVALPPLLAGRDLIGRARTGSGKTAAFGLPLLNRLADGGERVRALVLAPTRELALQVSSALKEMRGDLPVRVATVYGGSSYGPQLQALRAGVEVIVGTPGRIIDLLDRGSMDLSTVEFVVLDEADEMLRMGFVDDVETILGQTPETKQVALFSATMPAAIRRIAQTHLTDPQILQAESGGPRTDHIEQRWMIVPQLHKAEALLRLLRAEDGEATIVFARTRRNCAQITDLLGGQGIDVDALHGDLNQNAREQVLNKLRQRRVRVLVATDVAARGIDVEHVSHVINLDLPDGADTYTHRIGRTGRAGRKGVAITLVQPGEHRRFQSLIRQLKAEATQISLPTEASVSLARRKALVTELEALVADAEGVTDARAWLADILAGGVLEAEDVAAGALALIAGFRRLKLGNDLSQELPRWAQPRNKRFERHDDRGFNPQHDRGPQRHRDGPRPFEREGPRDRPRFDGDVDHVDLFFPIGRYGQIRPGDLVGALANEFNIPGKVIGRIKIHDKVSFVGLPREVAGQILGMHDSLTIRGMKVPMLPARPPREGGDGGQAGPDAGPARGPRPQDDRGDRRDGRFDDRGGPRRDSHRGPPRGGDRGGYERSGHARGGPGHPRDRGGYPSQRGGGGYDPTNDRPYKQRTQDGDRRDSWGPAGGDRRGPPPQGGAHPRGATDNRSDARPPWRNRDDDQSRSRGQYPPPPPPANRAVTRGDRPRRKKRKDV